MSANGKTPWATIVLILVNLCVATLVTLDRDGGVVLDWSFIPSSPTLLGLVMSPFLQDNMLHLLGNLVFLAAVGPFVELGSGSRRTVGIYFVGGLAGLASHYGLYLATGIDTPLMGASAAIAACVGYCSVRYFSAGVPLAPKLKVPIYVVAFLWLSLQVIGAFVSFGEGSMAIAYWAHIAGFAAGLGIALILKAPQAVYEEVSREHLGGFEHRGTGAKRAALEAHLERHPDDYASMKQLAEQCEAMGDKEGEATALMGIVKSGAPTEQRIEAVDRLHELDALGRISGPMRLRLADEWSKESGATFSVLLESLIDDPKEREIHPDALLMLAQIVPDSERSELALGRLRDEFPLSSASEIARQKGLID